MCGGGRLHVCVVGPGHSRPIGTRGAWLMGRRGPAARLEGRRARCPQTEVSSRQGLLGILSARSSDPGAASRWCGQGPALWAFEGSPVGWGRGAGRWLESSDRSVGGSGGLAAGRSPGSGSWGGGAHRGSRALAVKPARRGCLGPDGPRPGTASRSSGTGPGVQEGRAAGRGGLLMTRGDSAEKRGPEEDPQARGAAGNPADPAPTTAGFKVESASEPHCGLRAADSPVLAFRQTRGVWVLLRSHVGAETRGRVRVEAASLALSRRSCV